MPRTPIHGAASRFEGVQRVLSVAQPAAGTDWSLPLPGEGWWRILGMITTYTTSTVNTNRLLLGQYQLGGQAVIYFGGTLISLASTTYTVAWHNIPGGGFTSNSSPVFMTLAIAPDVILQPGGTIGSFTRNMPVGDQYGAVTLFMEEYYSDEYEPERKETWASTIESLSHHPEFAHIG